MKKTTLIRSDKPHAVNMPAGSNVAARKTTQKFTEPAPADETPTNVQKVVPVKAPKAKRITAPPPVAKTVRAKATKTAPPEAPPKIVKPKPAPAKAARPMPKLRNNQAPSSKAKAPEPDPTPIDLRRLVKDACAWLGAFVRNEKCVTAEDVFDQFSRGMHGRQQAMGQSSRQRMRA